MTNVTVYVAAGSDNLLAGRMYSQDRRGVETASFSYDDRYLAHPDAYPLDPLLPMVAGSLQASAASSMFGAFADGSPDRWGRTLIQRAERLRARSAGMTPRSMSELDLLLGVRDDLRQGAIRFRLDEGGPFLATEESGVPILTDLPALLDIAARVERETADYDELERLLRAGGSLGGARPKVHVLDADGRVAIAKFPSPSQDTWNVMAWEKVALDLARGAGLTVPDSSLIRIGDRHVLVVDRFDRQDGIRIGYASAMTMLEAVPGDQRSYLEIAEVVEERSRSTTAELSQLWRRVAFTIMISNTDDHLRNHGFLHDRGDSWALSPAFDLNPNPAHGPKYLSTAIDFNETRASIATLMRVADHFRLSAIEATEILAEVTRSVARWRQVARSHGLQRHDLDAMKPAFEHAEAQRARALTGSTPSGK